MPSHLHGTRARHRSFLNKQQKEFRVLLLISLAFRARRSNRTRLGSTIPSYLTDDKIVLEPLMILLRDGIK